MNKSKKRLILLTVVMALFLTCVAVFAENAGTDGDPLVSKSYIDGVIEEIKSYVDEKISSNESDVSGDTLKETASFEIVRLALGQRITFGESTEFIVRMGKGAVIASEKGGIADVTAGFDLSEGEETSANHLMIVPVDDGRGFTAIEDVIVMVKGSYKIN